MALPSACDVHAELARLGVDRAGREIMAPKGVLRAIRIDGLDARGASILKQELLAKGAECALPRGVYDLAPGEVTSAVILSTERVLNEVLRVLAAQPYGLKDVGTLVAEALRRVEEPPRIWRCGRFELPVGEATQVMGVLNVTPDSFSDGGERLDEDVAASAGLAMVADGAHLIDVGGESTRPGSAPVGAEEELRRIARVIERLAAEAGVPVSADTSKPEVARRALALGASVVNDIRGFRDPAMIDVVADSDCGVVVMHMQGEPATMQDHPRYDDLMGEIHAWLAERVHVLIKSGVAPERIAVDPGIGFGKTYEHNLEIIRRLVELRSLGLPIVLGASRKRFIGAVLGIDDPKDRLEGTAAAVALGIAGGAQVVRVHDVREMARVARMADAIKAGLGARLARAEA